jgi:hypothetical protein
MNSDGDLCVDRIIDDGEGDQEGLGNSISQNHKVDMPSNNVKWCAVARGEKDSDNPQDKLFHGSVSV